MKLFALCESYCAKDPSHCSGSVEGLYRKLQWREANVNWVVREGEN